MSRQESIPTTAAPTRVLQLIKGLGPGGAERLIVNHLGSADHKKFSYEVAYLIAEKNHLVSEIEQLDVPVHRLDGNALQWARSLRSPRTNQGHRCSPRALPSRRSRRKARASITWKATTVAHLHRAQSLASAQSSHQSTEPMHDSSRRTR